jgi:uncharacterized protein YjiS (DUF1127 family)
MSSTQIANGTVRLNASAGYIRGFFTSCSSAFQQWRDRQKLRTALHGLSDSALSDIGITRGEIEYVIFNRSIDSRCADGR